MIQVNLLPVDRRRAERTPIGRLVLILLGVMLASVLIVFFVWFKFILIPGQIGKRDELKQELASEKTRQIEAENALLLAKDTAHKNRKGVIEKLKPPFRWSDTVDLLCEKLEALHKKIWFDEIRIMEVGELRGKQLALGDLKVEGGLLVEANSAGVDPEPLLNIRHDVVQKPAPTAAAPPTPTAPGTPQTNRFLVDYFTGGILKVINFGLKEQAEYEERYSNTFSIEFYVRQGGTK
jgi:hypothetical protein